MTTNVYPRGSLIRITDGLAPASLEDCNFSNNAVTSVVRFNGRSWVFEASEWIRRADSVDQLGGFHQRDMSQNLFLDVEKRKYESMVRSTKLLWQCCLPTKIILQLGTTSSKIGMGLSFTWLLFSGACSQHFLRETLGPARSFCKDCIQPLATHWDVCLLCVRFSEP
jgi:hypothetical protein